MSGKAGALRYNNSRTFYRAPDAAAKARVKSGMPGYIYGTAAASADAMAAGAGTMSVAGTAAIAGAGAMAGAIAGAADTPADAETRRIAAPPVQRPPVKERLQRLGNAGAAAVAKKVPGISFFAVAGTLIVSFLMVLVVLAQINYNEAASESARTDMQLRELAEKQRTLELAFERSIDIKEVERFAKDELGMSRPDAAQIILISTEPRDSATAINTEDERGVRGFAEFVKSLTDYFKRGT